MTVKLTTDVKARLHRDKAHVLVLLGELKKSARELESPRFGLLCAALERAIGDHLNIVDGIVEAISQDEPGAPRLTAPRKQQR